jgi:hypothetical protein
MMFAGPVEAGEVGEFCMRCHGSDRFGVGGLRLAATTGSCCDKSFVSLRSISPWGGGLRTGRCPTLNLREMSETRPCCVRGAAAIGFCQRGKIVHFAAERRRKVIHNRRRGGCSGPFRRLMNHFGTGNSECIPTCRRALVAPMLTL